MRTIKESDWQLIACLSVLVRTCVWLTASPSYHVRMSVSVSVCGPVNPCYSTLSIPLPLRVNIGLTTCNAILSYACLTPKEPQPLFSSGCVCLCVCDCHSVSTCNSYCLFFKSLSILIIPFSLTFLHHFHFPLSRFLLFLPFFCASASPHPLSPHPSALLPLPTSFFLSLTLFSSPWPWGVTYLTAQLCACLDCYNWLNRLRLCVCEQFEGVIVSGGVCSGLRRVSRREEGSLSVCFSVCRGATDTSVCECMCPLKV